MSPPKTTEPWLHAFNEQIVEFFQYPNPGNNVLYPALGLCDESFELVNAARGNYDAVQAEAGDCLFYASALARELGGELGMPVGALALSGILTTPPIEVPMKVAGVIAGRVKKVARGDPKSDEHRETVLKLYLPQYLAGLQLALRLVPGGSLENSADFVLKKLSDRAARGVIKGDGDNR